MRKFEEIPLIERFTDAPALDLPLLYGCTKMFPDSP